MIQGELLSDIIEAVSNTYGNEFLDRLTLKLASIIRADYTFIAIFDKERYESKTISLVAKGAVAENMAYSLKDTPCAQVFDNSICYYPNDVQKFFPFDQLLIEMNIEGYIGSPLLNSKKEVMGLIVGLFEKEIQHKDQILTLFQIFSGRIAAELERSEYEARLEKNNHELETLVALRTSELTKTLEELRERQNQLVESEKMASLGLLSAGIAHEINNPLNFILGGYFGVRRVLEGSALESEKTKMFLEAIKEGVDRTSKIVKGLNQFTRSGDSTEERFDLHEILENCLVILTHSLRDLVQVKKDMFSQPLVVKGNSGKIHQVFLNILTNAIQAMEGKNGILGIQSNRDSKFGTIVISDTGVGIKKEYQNQIRNPFFTTKDPGKGVGLGLSIAYKIVQDHNGSIEMESEWGKGTTFRIILPIQE
ncbi:ATP-binding protein [Leptospira sp. 2 VSF19]|uniref:histidine kinase n=1 Tax=Leptospira soteropolitanensis TaxID=2950025 RepID=A0AAW5VNB1_9LEPT|nr:ATP-binding protein [Leptospira soteropolitanensis]MCW7493067.1 ATP-binding protein [Leptospira soteropolitanensis]MCW7500864.1 ATP-binding protein [Leptospira soteropolitanensis]MCW7522917.1 ATP-binding protein [Leptospira soteropolitanensis]MCW7526976.1 ATP-binding protein [Leptospira soteropolitanensis]MCW7530635.1 ATP-binding protein [Leptospira soteropolitanensis]